MGYIKKNKEIIINLSFCIIIFLIFYNFSKAIPLTGDDWDFAVQARTSSPIASAIAFYFKWSGRFFSEVWCFFMNSHKELWNIINPLIFVGIYIMIKKIINSKNNSILISILVLLSMIAINQQVRVQTYTWVTGSFYQVPLFLMLLYYFFIKMIIFNNKRLSLPLKFFIIIVNFYIGLTTQNAAAVNVFANITILIYCYFKNTKLVKSLFFLFSFSLISFLIMLLAPGANQRLFLENADWISFSLIDKITLNWNNFLSYTFTKNNFLLQTLSISFLFLNYQQFKFKHKLNFSIIVSAIINLICILFSFSEQLYYLTNINLFKIMFDHIYSKSALIICTIFYIVYLINILVQIRNLKNLEDYFTTLFLFLIGGSCNLVMLVSPTFAARSSIYTIYFITIIALLIIKTINFNRYIYCFLCLFSFLFAYSIFIDLDYKYTLISNIQKDRMMKISYYEDHPEDLEIYLPRFPENIIHGGDIEKDNLFHMRAFKEYYYLNPNSTIYFYK